MKIFVTYIGKYKWRSLLGLSGKFLGTLTELWIPMILATIIDDIALKEDLGLTLQWGGYMLIVCIISLILNLLANYLSSKVASFIGHDMREDMFQKIMYLSSAQVDKLTISSLETRMTSDSYNIQQVMAMLLRMGIRAPVLLIGSVFMSFLLDPVLACIILFIMPVILVIVYVISKRGILFYKDVQLSEDGLASCVRENVLGIRVIKALSAKNFETSKFASVNKKLTQSDIKATANMIISNPLINGILNVGSVAVIWFGASRVVNGACESGVLLAFITYFTSILAALMNMSRIFIMTTKGMASGNRIQEIFDFQPDLKVISSEPKSDLPFIHFQDVSFSYQGTQQAQMNLSHITFSLNKGETLGIIGATGSGKSTLLLLLMRFYDVTDGAIYINGENIKSIPLAQLHQMFGVSLQSDYLFSDTILENICFGRNLEVTEIKDSAKVAQAEQFITAYDEQFDFKLAIKGSNLSGGQKQRLLIARAVAADPDILVLDDSTSALDYKTDSLLRQELYTAYKDTTTIMVAQRISSIKDADLILILDNGEIIDVGKHETLIERCDLYRNISEHQLGAME